MTRSGLPFFFLEVLSVLFSVLGPYRCSTANLAGQIVVPMPTQDTGGKIIQHNDYRCASAPFPLKDEYIVQYEPRADPRLAHHMLLFGCKHPVKSGSWDCETTSYLCKLGDTPQIIFAWALNASGLDMPPNVGFKVGPSAGINFLVVQIHYGHPEEVPDLLSVNKEALVIHTTKKRQLYVASIYLLGSGGSLKPGQKHAYTDSACEFTGSKPIHPFAFRTHAHSLGQQIVGYVVKPGDEWEVIGTRSPQDAQAFYPVKTKITVNPSDWLAVRCDFNTEDKHHSVHMGPNSEDEMCNFYIMYYTTNDKHKIPEDGCWAMPPYNIHFPTKLPELSSVDTPTNSDTDSLDEGENKTECPVPIPSGSTICPVPVPTLSPSSTSHFDSTTPALSTPTPVIKPTSSYTSGRLMLSEDWPLNGFPIPAATLGQITAAAIDAKGMLYILHRGPVTWDYDSFNTDFTYRHIIDGPIKVPTLLKFSSTGQPMQAWGSHLFFMPHGLTIDPEGNFWVTDVAMHQVFKFNSIDDKKASLVLGKTFIPGNSYATFCQPTSVAVESSGNIYVADGYCNRRIIKFNKEGRVVEVWQTLVANTPLSIPHKIILNAAETSLFVADRENHRVLSFATSSRGHGQVFCREEELKGKPPYAISFNDSESDWPMYGVFGKTDHDNVMGFTIDKSGKKISIWGPDEGFDQPHDLVVDTIHNAVYVTEIGPNRIWKFVPIPTLLKDISEDLEDILNSYPRPLESSLSLPSDLPDDPHYLKEVPTTKHPSETNLLNTTAESSDNKTETLGDMFRASDTKQEKANIMSDDESKSIVGVNVGVIVAVFAVATLIILVTIGVIKEHKFIKFKTWRILQAGDRDTTIGVKASSGTTTQRAVEKKKKKKKRLNPRKKLQSLLGPSQLGFSRLRTYDSDSEEEEFPVFNRV